MVAPMNYHNDIVEEERSVSHQRMPIRESELELAAFERGRQQGEVEAVRRLEAEGQLVGPGMKSFRRDEQVLNPGAMGVPAATANVVEIEHLTWIQMLAALFGEVCAIGYLVIMAIWIDQYRGGVGWDDSTGNNNAGMFNVHVITGFTGLFAASQAYMDYRLLPLRTPTHLNKLVYILWQVVALASFALSIACAVMTQPGTNSMSMHAWTSYLAVFVYAVHAIYSSLRVLLAQDYGIGSHRWNESVNVAEQPAAHNWHLSAEQRRDHNQQLPTLYRAAPLMTRLGHPARTEYNPDGSINTATGIAPTWSESEAITANNFFLVPRAKWAVASLVGLGAAVLIGLGEWEVLLAAGLDQWSQDGRANREGTLDYTDTEAILIGVIGLATMAATIAICYAAMPPRTVVAKGQFAAVPITNSIPAAETRHGSISEAAAVNEPPIRYAPRDRTIEAV
jgi:hypothetical protein